VHMGKEGGREGGREGGKEGRLVDGSLCLILTFCFLPPSLPPSLLADSAGLTISILVGIVLVACRRLSHIR